MGIFDKLKGKMTPDRTRKLSDAAEKQVNQRTGNKYQDQVDTAQQKIEGRYGVDRDKPDQQQ
ncbi:antitoxin [Streptomyces sp. NPDC006610]|uniref:antitoxin n=1 Tax=Streptomyces sp. NPDC006610 TaxID=3154584 RepID=UPI00339F0000